MIAKGLQRMGPVIIFLIINSVNTYAQEKSAETYTGWDELKNDVPQWLRDAKFGIYFHWGVYTVPAYNSEWYSRGMYVPDSKSNRHYLESHNSLKQFGYKDYIPSFKAPHFNAAEWADLFIKAGARFAGPVAEHHDGFAMWASALTPFNAKDMGPKRDVVGELEQAIRRRGLKFFTSLHHELNYTNVKLKPEWAGADPKYAKLYGSTMEHEEWLAMWRDKCIEVVDKYHP